MLNSRFYLSKEEKESMLAEIKAFFQETGMREIGDWALFSSWISLQKGWFRFL